VTDHSGDGGVDSVGDARALRLQVDEGDHVFFSLK
jgi:hypothetical protein